MRILIGVTSCHKAVYPEVWSRQEPAHNSMVANAARNTWIADANRAGVDVKFFFGRYNDPPGTVLVPRADEIFLDVDDSYDGLVEKVTAMAAWAWDQGYDYFMKVDIDSYVNIKNLLAEEEFFNWDYVGRGWGLGYMLSRKAMRVVKDEKQVRSWAEDSHVIRSLFAWADKGNEIKLYGDGRFIFLPNLLKTDIPLYDRTFVVVNPANEERMKILNETGSLAAIVPGMKFTKEDLWTDGRDRVEHCSAINAFAVTGTKMPYTYAQWVQLTPYDRQPFLDYSQIVFACLETDQMKNCPTFETWIGPLDHREELQKWALDINLAAMLKIKQASQHFRIAQGDNK